MAIIAIIDGNHPSAILDGNYCHQRRGIDGDVVNGGDGDRLCREAVRSCQETFWARAILFYGTRGRESKACENKWNHLN